MIGADRYPKVDAGIMYNRFSIGDDTVLESSDGHLQCVSGNVMTQSSPVSSCEATVVK